MCWCNEVKWSGVRAYFSVMLISESHQFIFVHIRKAAGTSLRQILERVSLPKNNSLWYKLLSRGGWAVNYPNYSFRKHANLIEAERSMPTEKFQQYFKFAIVRNPWDRLVSEYEYIKRQPSHSRHKKVTSQSFADFVSYQSKRSDGYQVNALKLKNGQLGMDFIGKFEALDESLAHISSVIGVSFAGLPHINLVKRRDYRTYFNDALRDLVAQHWQADIQAFDYQFE